jgi:hypothetical protein
MGFLNYFQPAKPSKTVHGQLVPASKVEEIKEKPFETPLDPIAEHAAVRRGLGGIQTISMSTLNQSRTTLDDGQRSVDDIKHQVLLNHLYQQQNSLMWNRNVAGSPEGVMLRKSRGHYIFRPADLSQSMLAQAMSILNVQVCADIV